MLDTHSPDSLIRCPKVQVIDLHHGGLTGIYKTAALPTFPPINSSRQPRELGFWDSGKLTPMRPMVTLSVRQISSFPMGPYGRAAVRNTVLRRSLPRAPPRHQRRPLRHAGGPAYHLQRERSAVVRAKALLCGNGFRDRPLQSPLDRAFHSRKIGGWFGAQNAIHRSPLLVHRQNCVLASLSSSSPNPKRFLY